MYIYIYIYIYTNSVGHVRCPARTGETVQLSAEIERLAEAAETDPHSYLVDLGFSEQGADNLLGMANLFDKIKSGMTF